MENPPITPVDDTARVAGQENLEDLYRLYFSSPAGEEADNLTQVSLFDYSVTTYSNDSTVVSK